MIFRPFMVASVEHKGLVLDLVLDDRVCVQKDKKLNAVKSK